MTYYVSKYALSNNGKIEAVEAESEGDGYVRPVGYWSSIKLGRDVFKTPEEAIVAAEKARIKKIASLKKQVAKIEALKFWMPLPDAPIENGESNA